MPTTELPAGIDEVDARLIDRLQQSLPLTERPFRDIGAELDLDEDEVLHRLQRMLGRGVLSRFGPLFHIERAGGQFILAALEVPEDRYAEVTALVNSLPEVAHNYRREHSLNMWFIVAAETPGEAWAACDQIEAVTHLQVHCFPKEREYYDGLYLPLRAKATVQREPHCKDSKNISISHFDRELIFATQAGLPIVPRPYDSIAALLGTDGEAVRKRFSELQSAGVVRRIAAVPNQYQLGYVAHGMSVWDVDDEEADRLGELIGSQPAVSHCYRRPRKPGLWRYNLFAMLHSHSREEILDQAEKIAELLGPACHAHEVLFTNEILKKTGLRLRKAA